jgi:peroxiredoxin
MFTLAVPEGYKREQFHRPEQPEPLAAGVIAPDWTLTNASGQPVSLQSLRGKLVMLDFWYTTCGPCVLAMPTIQKLHERFKERGVAVYGINPWAHDSADAIRLMAKRGYTYGLVLGSEEVAKAYNVSGYPTFYLIGDDGTIIYNGVGYGEEREAELVEKIEKYLHERGR